MRRRVTAHLQQRLFRGKVLYRLQLDGRVDNFDQRATADLQALLDGLTCALFGNTSDHLVRALFRILYMMDGENDEFSRKYVFIHSSFCKVCRASHFFPAHFFGL